MWFCISDIAIIYIDLIHKHGISILNVTVCGRGQVYGGFVCLPLILMRVIGLIAGMITGANGTLLVNSRLEN